MKAAGFAQAIHEACKAGKKLVVAQDQATGKDYEIQGFQVDENYLAIVIDTNKRFDRENH